MSDEASPWKPTVWTIEVWSDESTDDLAADIVHEACVNLMVTLTERCVKTPALICTGKVGPRAQKRDQG